MYRDHKLTTTYDKTDTSKKHHKIKQGKLSDDKYISKDKYLTRPEKHESETQPSISVPSINGKPTKKLTTISPNAKRKSGKTHSKYFAQQTIEMVKDKRYLKVNENHEDHLSINVMDKRHSIDAGYASLPDGRVGLGEQLGDFVGRQTTSPSGALKKVDSTRRQYRSSSSICKGEQKNMPEQSTTHLLHHQQNKCSTQQKFEYRQQDSSFAYPQIDYEQSYIEVQDRYNNDSAPFSKKPSYVRNSKSDVTNSIGSSLTKSTENIVRGNDRLCYEKRLKKLEEEIEKYKKEVKSFCKETFNYTHQKSPHKHSKGNSQIQSQIQNNFRNATNNQVQHIRPHTQQQAYLERTKSDGKNNRHQQQQTQQNLSNTKPNPYYDLLAKVTRDFGCKNGINSAIFNGTLNDGTVPVVTAKNEGGEYIAGRTTKISNNDVLIDEKHQSKTHQSHQQPTHNIQRNGRPMAKFIARPPQHSSHLTKHTITNCQ